MLVSTEPIRLECGADTDCGLAAVPEVPAVFVIRVRDGKPYLARTNLLRRRLNRLLGVRPQPSKLLNLRDVADYVEYWPFASRLESSLLLYDLARSCFPDDYQRVLKLRKPHLVRLILSNPYPRTTVTTRLTTAGAVQFGPFRTRTAAEQFESGFLDFFQLRRCQEDLVPSPEHPGCVYGEMNRCMRPCQQHVSASEYSSEAQRVQSFLESDGESLLESLGRTRDRLSEAMEFEEAARQHKRVERAAALIQSRDALATDVTNLSGVAVTRATETDAVCLWFFCGGRWHRQITLPLRPVDGAALPLDRRVKDAAVEIAAPIRSSLRERQDHLALLFAWFYSSWRDGEWVSFPSRDQIPYRKIVNAIHRVASRPA